MNTPPANAAADTAKPFISIVLATYNAEDCLPVFLESLAHQRFNDYELLIADGNSSDATTDIIKAHESDHLHWFVSETDSGIYSAWNKATAHTRGEWILYLGADDTFGASTALSGIADDLREVSNANIALAYTSVTLLNALGQEERVLGAPFPEIEWQLNHGMPIDLPHSGMFHRGSVMRSTTGFNESLKIASDYEMILRLIRLGGYQIKYLGDRRFLKKGTDGISVRRADVAVWETMKVRQGLGLRGVTPVWIAVWIRAKLRRVFRIALH
ncbi:glycosyltransferase [Halioglobus pacificus]|uniref:Glycosyltransferase 2-like domain-containing protein n=1 Tax=Parahalioglobus pacificus TaxID=930806 RepID=A0A919CNP7_9GAMM|nr:glycosyltransferase [Halioglobus pacificus]GHD39361.1 hypothetical protein GCM10007053_30730 [Halioglobus pacificus]